MTKPAETDVPNAMLQVALLQLAGHGTDVAANCAAGLEACRDAARLGADIALFPEVWSIGYRACPEDPAGRREWEALAVSDDGDFVTAFAALTHELRMAIAITYQQRCADGVRNAMSLLDMNGERAFTYTKVHTCDFGADSAYMPGAGFEVAEVETRCGPVMVGAMICFDRQFPESARVLMLKGAELVLTPNACTLETNLLGQFRARAFENMMALAMANYPAPECNGHSTAVSPIVWGTDGHGLDPILVEAGSTEGIHLAGIDLTALRAYRARETEANSYRKPHEYDALTDMTVRPSFRRDDDRRQSAARSAER